jgi:hypothetical protein
MSIGDAPANALIRGYESYDDMPGTMGVFTEHIPAEE